MGSTTGSSRKGSMSISTDRHQNTSCKLSKVVLYNQISLNQKWDGRKRPTWRAKKPICRLTLCCSHGPLRLITARSEMRQEFRQFPREPTAATAARKCNEVLSIWCLQLPDMFQCTNVNCFHSALLPECYDNEGAKEAQWPPKNTRSRVNVKRLLGLIPIESW